MKKEQVIMVEDLMEYAERNDYFNLTTGEFKELDNAVSEALERQLPLQVKASNDFTEHYGRLYICPFCKESQIGVQNYCKECGQKLTYCELK